MTRSRPNDPDGRPLRRLPPTWACFTAAAVLAPTSLVAVGYASAHLGHDPSAGGMAYAPAIVLAGLAAVAVVLGSRRLSQRDGVPTSLPKVLGLISIGFVAAMIAGVALAGRFQPEGSQDAGLWVAMPSAFLVLAFTWAAWNSLRGWSRGRRLPRRFVWFSLLAFSFALAMTSTVIERAGGGGGSADFSGLQLLLTVLGACVFAVLSWRNLDEAAREAHKWAWYWGGSLAIIPGFIFASLSSSVEWAGRLSLRTPGELVQFGALTVLASMLVGYLIAWGVWWLRTR